MTLTLESRLPDAIRSGIAGFPVLQAHRAETAISRAIGTSIDDPALWWSSGLTGDGFPFELSFTTADDDLRWTLDVSARLPEGQRLFAARAALARLEADPGGDALARLQPGLSERVFGAWIGGRHGTDGDRYKLYLDWQDDPASQEVLRKFGLPRPRFLPKLTVPMVALGPGTQRSEVYYRAEPPPEALINILAPANLGHRAEAAKALIEQTWGNRLRDRLPGGRIGISYSVSAPGAEPQITLFFFARSLWGGDARIRERMRALIGAAGRDDRAYKAATLPIKSRNTAKTRHGLVALGIGETSFSWGIGLRPVTAT